MNKKQLRKALEALREKRSGYVAELDKVVGAAAAETRDFTADENVSRGRLEAQIASTDEQIELREDELRKLKKEERKKAQLEAVAQMRRDLGLGDVSGLTGIEVRELPVYTKRSGVSFVKDLAIAGFGPGQVGSAWARANERLRDHGRFNHHRALELDEKHARMDEEKREKFARSVEGYFVRQMVEAVQGREERGGQGRGEFLSYRALSTVSGAGGEFVPPDYLTADWIKFLRAGRVVANTCRHFDLPDGTMVMWVPKVTAGTSVDVQGTQNTNVSNTDLQTAYISIPIVTVAGAQIISLQLLERSPIHFDEVIWGDLAAAQAQRMDLQVLNGSGSNGQMTGILNTSGINTITWTQTSPTVKGLMGQVGLAKADIADAIFRPATHGFMVPTVWEWIGQSVDTTNRPLVVPTYQGPFNAAAVAEDSATAEGSIGRHFSGLDTYEDANIPQNLGSGTNQSVVVVSRMQENFLYESPMVTRALPQTFGLQMSVLLQAYNYAAFTAARYPAATSVVTGTGLASANLAFNS